MDCDNIASSEDKAEFMNEIQRILDVPNVSKLKLNNLTKQLKSVTPNKVNEFFMLMGSSLKFNRRKGGKSKSNQLLLHVVKRARPKVPEGYLQVDP